MEPFLWNNSEYYNTISYDVTKKKLPFSFKWETTFWAAWASWFPAVRLCISQSLSLRRCSCFPTIFTLSLWSAVFIERFLNPSSDIPHRILQITIIIQEQDSYPCWWAMVPLTCTFRQFLLWYKYKTDSFVFHNSWWPKTHELFLGGILRNSSSVIGPSRSSCFR